MSNYDVIVIGAGNGGLSAALTFALSGKKVAVFEAHNLPGGCGTSFRRGRFEFEVALHQLSSMGTKEKPGDLRKLFQKYEIEDKIEWIEIKDLFRVNFHDGTGVTLPADREKCVSHLSQEFPSEASNIKRYFDTVYKFCEESADFAAKNANSQGDEPSLIKKHIIKIAFPKIYPTLANYALKGTQEVLDEFFSDSKLKLALSAYWSFMGVPPENFPFTILAKCTYIYIEDKPFYLRGGSQVMSQALAESICNKDGKVFYNSPVASIIIENNKAVGVKTKDGKEHRAKVIVSNISPIHTYTKLLKKEEIPQKAVEYLKPYKVGISALTCFIGLNCTPEKIGFTSSFTLNYQSLDANRDYLNSNNLMPDIDPLVATCYTVDDPKVSPPGTSIITAGALKFSEPWERLSPQEYHKKKYEAGQIIVDRLEKMYPGFSNHIETISIATPLTHMRYLRHPGGAIYGYEQDLKSSVFFFPTESYIDGLEFSSGWVHVCGFGPNYLNGNNVANRILANWGDSINE